MSRYDSSTCWFIRLFQLFTGVLRKLGRLSNITWGWCYCGTFNKIYYNAYFSASMFTCIYFVLLFCETLANMKLCIHYYYCLEIPFFTLFEILQNWLKYLHTTFDTGWSRSVIAVLVMKEKPWFYILSYILIRIPNTVVRLILSVSICVNSLDISNVDFNHFFQRVATLSILRYPFGGLGKGIWGFKEAKVSQTHKNTHTHQPVLLTSHFPVCITVY